jgi:SAM-dependent methyltransferase
MECATALTSTNIEHTLTQHLRVQCPLCESDIMLSGISASCSNGHAFGYENGILDILSNEDVEHFDAFLKQYESVRSSERWGDGSAEYYQNLPFRDITGEHNFEWRVKCASYYELFKQLKHRQASTVLDVGAGNCWLSYRLWNEGFTGAATDIRVDDYDGLAAVSRYWDSATGWPRMRTSFDTPGFAPGQFDSVIFNASLHYAADPVKTLRNFLPLLSEHGALYVIDSPVYQNADSGRQMMKEREREFLRKYDIRMTDDTQSYYLTFEQIGHIAIELGLHLKSATPKYGLKWQLRPVIATILGRREPASFAVHIFEKG